MQADPKPVQALSFVHLCLGKDERDIELLGGPQDAVEQFLSMIDPNASVTCKVITKAEACKELYLIKSGAGVYLEHPYDIITNEIRMITATNVLMSLVKRLGIGFIFHPVGLVSDED